MTLHPAMKVALLAVALTMAVIAKPARAQDARVATERSVGPRAVELQIETAAFAQPTLVRVYLPAGYGADVARRWPVTYYLGGTNGEVTRFEDFKGEEVTRSFPSIVVAPTAHAGYWSDWYNGGAFGPPKYETFVIDQLLPLIDARYRTNGRRALMGESMGGFGVMMLAARHPDLFEAASSLSGAVDTNTAAMGAIVTASPSLQVAGPAPPDSIFGPRESQEVRWRGHNPVDLAENLRGIRLQVRVGDGVPPPTDPSTDCANERVVNEASVNFEHRLTKLQIPHEWQLYENYCHNGRLFTREIVDSLPLFEQVFAQPPPSMPEQLTYVSIEPRFAVWGWQVEADPQRALEFLRLEHAGRDGFTLAGSGRTKVMTPPLFAGLKQVDVNGKPHRPDAAGRLSLVVDLGPPHAEQQYTEGAPTTTVRRSVSFAPHTLLRITRATGRRTLRVCADVIGSDLVMARVSVKDRRGRPLAQSRAHRFADNSKCLRMRLRRARGPIVLSIRGRDRYGHPVAARTTVKPGAALA